MTNVKTAAPSTSTDPASPFAPCIDAMRDISSEQAKWDLGDAIVAAIPDGSADSMWAELAQQADDAGVRGRMSGHTLRTYRDTASRWDKVDRIPGVSYSAHREVAHIKEPQRTQILRDAIADPQGANGQPARVTVRAVRARVAGATSGKKAGPVTTATRTPAVIITADLATNNGGILAQEIASQAKADTVDLDALKAGIESVLTAVEKHIATRNTKAAKKSAPAAPAPAPAPSTSTGRKAPAPKIAPSPAPAADGVVAGQLGDY